MKTKRLHVILTIIFFTSMGTTGFTQVVENVKQEKVEEVKLTEDQQKIVNSLSQYGEMDLLKIRERYIYKLRTSPEIGDQYVLDRINQQLNTLRGIEPGL